MSRDNYWLNEDGLVVGFGTRTTSTNVGTKVNDADGPYNTLVMRVKGEDVPAAAAATDDGLASGAVIPSGAVIISASFEVLEAFAGANAVLDIGTYNATTKAAVAAAGIDSLAVANIDAVGDTIACDGAGVGAATAVPTQIAVELTNANAFTAGEGILTVKYAIERED